MNMFSRTRLLLTRLCTVVVLATSIPSSLTFAQSPPPDESIPPLMDEPVLVPGGESGTSPEVVRGMFWPAFFGQPYSEGQSSICIGCEQTQGRHDAYVVGPVGSAQPFRKFGWFIPLSTPVSVTWIPDSTRSETGVISNVTYTANQSSRTKAVAALLISTTGNWSVVTGTIDELDTSLTTPNGGTQYTQSLFSIYATHADPTDATQWAADFATGALFDQDIFRPGPSGGEQGGEPDYAGYADCKLAAEIRKNDRIYNAGLTRDNGIAALNLTQRMLFVGGAAGATGATIGGVVGSSCGAGTIPGIAYGGVGGFLIGSIVGGISYVEAKDRLHRAYRQAVANARLAYTADVQACKTRFRIPMHYD